MFEKVNPCHSDKVADRIAGALVDIAYDMENDPRIAVEVLLGHGVCHIIAETSVHIPVTDIIETVERIAGPIAVDYVEVPQDSHLAGSLFVFKKNIAARVAIGQRIFLIQSSS